MAEPAPRGKHDGTPARKAQRLRREAAEGLERANRLTSMMFALDAERAQVLAEVHHKRWQAEQLTQEG